MAIVLTPYLGTITVRGIILRFIGVVLGYLAGRIVALRDVRDEGWISPRLRV